MIRFTDCLIPLVIGGILLFGACRGTDVFASFLDGARSGLATGFSILPALVALTTCVGMFKASGALDLFCCALAPLGNLLGLPKEALPLAMLRPISGSGAMVIFQDILSSVGPDSFAGRVAGVMLGSTETTFYTIAVYFGAAGIQKSRHTLPSALSADLTGFVVSALLVRLLFGVA